MSAPLVSIVIPTYNQPQYIIRAVQSALMQDYSRLEVVVSDDSDNDDTEQLLIDYISAKKIKYFHNKPKLGRVKNYRTCLYQYAEGEWVLNLDGDDYLTDKTFISEAISLIYSSKEKIVFAQCGGSIISETGEVIERRMPRCQTESCVVSGKEYLSEFIKKRRFLHLTTLYNAEIAKQIDFYRFNHLSSDLESFMRLALLGNILLINKNAGVWFQHANNTSSNAYNHEIIDNTTWVDSVVSFAKQLQKREISVESEGGENDLLSEMEPFNIHPVFLSMWKYIVKQQELTGLFYKEIKAADSKKKKLKRMMDVLIRHPKTFFFPVFLKKMIFDLGN